MDHMGRTELVVKLNLKLQWQGQVYMIIVTRTYLLKERQQFQTGTAAAVNNRNKKVIFRNCASFTDCISEIKK